MLRRIAALKKIAEGRGPDAFFLRSRERFLEAAPLGLRKYVSRRPSGRGGVLRTVDAVYHTDYR